MGTWVEKKGRIRITLFEGLFTNLSQFLSTAIVCLSLLGKNFCFYIFNLILIILDGDRITRRHTLAISPRQASWRIRDFDVDLRYCHFDSIDV